MMRVIFTRIAIQELEDAARYYELEHSGIGRRFKEEVEKSALRIAKYPNSVVHRAGEVRKCLLHKFRYKLMYFVEEDHILVIAVAHQHRKPIYWVGREET